MCYLQRFSRIEPTWTVTFLEIWATNSVKNYWLIRIRQDFQAQKSVLYFVHGFWYQFRFVK